MSRSGGSILTLSRRRRPLDTKHGFAEVTPHGEHLVVAPIGAAVVVKRAGFVQGVCPFSNTTIAPGRNESSWVSA
jgi:hypothetical protein